MAFMSVKLMMEHCVRYTCSEEPFTKTMSKKNVKKNNTTFLCILPQVAKLCTAKLKHFPLQPSNHFNTTDGDEQHDLSAWAARKRRIISFRASTERFMFT